MGIVNDVLDDGIGGIAHNVITAKLEDLVNWSRSRSSSPASAWKCFALHHARPTS
jgi:NADH-quinone oxidoreductase subunit B